MPLCKFHWQIFAKSAMILQFIEACKIYKVKIFFIALHLLMDLFATFKVLKPFVI